MTKKFLPLLTSGAITLMIAGSAFASDCAYEEDYGGESPKKKARLTEQSYNKLSIEAPESKVYMASLRFKLILKQNPDEKIKEKLRSVLSASAQTNIDAATNLLKESLERDRNLIVNNGPQEGARLIFEDLNAIYSKYLAQYQYLDLLTQAENDRYYQKASLGYAFTLPKLDGQATNEKRLQLLEDIASSNRFSEKRKAFAQFAIIEQKAKHAFIEPTEPPYDYAPEKARSDYNNLKKNKNMSVATRLSTEYHLAEFDVKKIGIVSQSLDSIGAEFQRISDHPSAHSFTQMLSKKYLSEIEKDKKNS